MITRLSVDDLYIIFNLQFQAFSGVFIFRLVWPVCPFANLRPARHDLWSWSTHAADEQFAQFGTGTRRYAIPSRGKWMHTEWFNQ